MNPKDKILSFLKDHPGAFVSAVQKGTGTNSRTETIRLLSELAENGTIIKELKEGKAAYTLDDPDLFTDTTDGEIDWQHLTFEKNNKFENEQYSLVLPDQFEICEEDGRDFVGRYTVDNDETYTEGLQILPGARISDYDNQFPNDVRHLVDADLIITVLEMGCAQQNDMLGNVSFQIERVSLGNTEGLIQAMEMLPDEMYLHLCNGIDTKMFTFKFYGLGLTREQQKNLVLQIMATFHDKKKREAKDHFDSSKYEWMPKDNYFLSQFEEDLENASKVRQIKITLDIKLNNMQLQQKISNGKISTSTQIKNWIDRTLPSSLHKQVQGSANYISQVIDYYRSIEWEDENAEPQSGWYAIAGFIEDRRYHQITFEDEIIPCFSKEMEELLIDEVLPHLIEEKEIEDDSCLRLQQQLEKEHRNHEAKLVQHNQEVQEIENNKSRALQELEEKHKQKLVQDIEKATAKYDACQSKLSQDLKNTTELSEQTQKELDDLGLFGVLKKNRLKKELDALASQSQSIQEEQHRCKKQHTDALVQLETTSKKVLENEKAQLEQNYRIPKPPVFQGVQLEQKIQQTKRNLGMQKILLELNRNGKAITEAKLAEKTEVQDPDQFKTMLDILENRKYIQAEPLVNGQNLYKPAFQEKTFSLSKSRLESWIPEYLFSKGGKATMKELEKSVRVKLRKSDLDTDLLQILRQLEHRNKLILSCLNGTVYCILTQEGLAAIDLSIQDKTKERRSGKRTDNNTIKEWIKEIIYDADHPLSITEIARGLADYGLEISNQKTSALVSQIVKTGLVYREVVDGVARFSRP